MLKLTQVKPGQLADLFQTVNKRVSVNKQLAGRFGNVEVVFEEALKISSEPIW